MCAFAATPIGKRMYDWLNSHLKQGLLAVADCGGMLCVQGCSFRINTIRSAKSGRLR